MIHFNVFLAIRDVLVHVFDSNQIYVIICHKLMQCCIMAKRHLKGKVIIKTSFFQIKFYIDKLQEYYKAKFYTAIRKSNLVKTNNK